MGTSRREFIKKSFYGLLALMGLGFLIPGVKVLTPAEDRRKALVYFPLISEDDIPRVGVKKAELLFTVSGKERKSRVFIVSNAGGIAVFSATCSHLGCLVNYHKDKREFICPCHGGRYDLAGKNIAGPPPAPLTKLPARSQDGIILVGVKV
ncbi:MAG TPA: ubiquinol-cytochrome c reductase iron-sulfur subunit [Nitrospirota bacterium]|nr:ubiquinol-cytochrome c reductase iron-sulfur subunit [Nitrospirota bacterium]